MEEPYYYRNKAQFSIGQDKDGNIITGFYAGRTNSIIANTKCYLDHDINEVILNKLIKFITENHITAYNKGNYGLYCH